MMGVEDRLPGGLATADDVLLDPRRLEATLDAIGVPPLALLLFKMVSSRAEPGRCTVVDELGWILLDIRGACGSF